MDANSDDFNVGDDGSETQSLSNNSVYTDPASSLSGNSGLFVQSSSIHSMSNENYIKELNDNVRELKAQLQTECPLEWFRKFDPAEHNPKIELNLLLHDAIQEQTLKELVLKKGAHFRSDEQMIAEIIQNNDPCLLQRVFEEIVNDRRQQHIIYTEILFRPDIFNFGGENPKIKLKNMMASYLETIINCIRFFTTNDAVSSRKNTIIVESNAMLDRNTINSPTSSNKTFLPTHIKILLMRRNTSTSSVLIQLLQGCNWNNVTRMPQFIRFARDYPQDIVGVDFHGDEDDCRRHWPDFQKYTKILHHHRIRCQASMSNFKDLQLIDEVVKNLGIERLCEAYEIVLSAEHLENTLMRHGVHLVICPLSSAYTDANHRTNDIVSETGKKRNYQSTSSLDDPIRPYELMNYLQSESLNYSITSRSPLEYKENLSSIYKNLFDKNKDLFSCEHMQFLNENALKSSFASQKVKTELMSYMRENYTNCHRQTILLQQFQEKTEKWRQEMNEIIDNNAQIAVEFGKKIRNEKVLKRLNQQQKSPAKLSVEEEEDEENEDNQVE